MIHEEKEHGPGRRLFLEGTIFLGNMSEELQVAVSKVEGDTQTNVSVRRLLLRERNPGARYTRMKRKMEISGDQKFLGCVSDDDREGDWMCLEC